MHQSNNDNTKKGYMINPLNVSLISYKNTQNNDYNHKTKAKNVLPKVPLQEEDKNPLFVALKIMGKAPSRRIFEKSLNEQIQVHIDSKKSRVFSL